jgi:phosphomannomutase
MSIFRAYDVRGIYGQTIGIQDTLKTSFIFARRFGNGGPIIVGRDNRRSSTPISLSALAGITAAGAEAVDIGMVPTPLLYFAVAHSKAKGGVMVTASHNPVTYNGLKLVEANARPLTYETGIGEIEREFRNVDIDFGLSEAADVRREDIRSEYVDFVTRGVRASGDMKVVFELGNGTTGPVLEKIVERLSLNATILNGEPDSSFPNGMINPANQDTLAGLTKAVRKERADLGIGLDVDGDRIGVVTRSGRFLFGDFLLAILSRGVLRKHKGATILSDVRASRSVINYIRKLGGSVKLTRVGHSYIANAMLDGSFPLGGELSGHVYFKDGYYGYDDGIYCATKLIQLLSEEAHDLEEILGGFEQTFVSPEIRVQAPEEKKFSIVKSIEEELRSKGAHVDTMDGVRAELENGWFSIRASNTEPALVIRAEGYGEGDLERMLDQVNRLISSAQSVKET